jgi:hypothetical protein
MKPLCIRQTRGSVSLHHHRRRYLHRYHLSAVQNEFGFKRGDVPRQFEVKPDVISRVLKRMRLWAAESSYSARWNFQLRNRLAG